MIKKINLEYPLDSLEPYYSKETLNIHYNTLYAGYVDNTNATLTKLEKVRKNKDFENIKCLEKTYLFLDLVRFYMNYFSETWDLQFHLHQT